MEEAPLLLRHHQNSAQDLGQKIAQRPMRRFMPPGPGVFPGRRDAAVWCIQVNKASCALCHRRRSVASKFKASCWCERLLAPKHNLACWGRPAFILRVGMDISQLECTHPRVWALLSAAQRQVFISGGGNLVDGDNNKIWWSWGISGAEKRRFFVCSHTHTLLTSMCGRATRKYAKSGSLSGKMGGLSTKTF